MYRPLIGITMGDPSGNGPELSVKALMKPELYAQCRPLIVGDALCIAAAKQVVQGAGKLRINAVTSAAEGEYEFGTIDVLDMKVVDVQRRLFRKDRCAMESKYGVESTKAAYRESQKMCGEAAFQYVRKVIAMALAGEIDATVTNALNKEYMNLAGHHFSGHTDIYAHYTNTEKYSMMLVHGDLRVVHVSTHVSMREACDRVKKDRVLDVIRLAHEGCRAIGISEPQIGVAGLNCHCGEHGLFGREEIEEIQPAIDLAMAEGIIIPEKAPTPPDTIFSKAVGGWYDIVVAMYHDQGHIPLKLKGFVYNRAKNKWDAIEGVNITLGIPIIRTSVDHGTGEDYAGDGNANAQSLTNAVDYAVRMVHAKRARE